MQSELPDVLSHKTVALPCGEICYLEVGEGIPIVLLHGAPMTSLGLIRVVEGLKAKYRVVVPDLPGFGRSPAAEGFGFSLAEYSAFVGQFLVALKLKCCVLFINDSSGCMGLHAAPEIADRLAAIVVADTVPLPMTGLVAPVGWILQYIMGSRAMRWLNRRLNLLPWMVATLAPMTHPFDRKHRRAMTRQFDTAEKRDLVLHVFAQMGRDREFIQAAAQRATQLLRDKPVLLLYGQFDPMRLVGGISRFKKIFARTRVAIIPWEEHFPILGSGARVAAEIDAFVTQVREQS